MCSKHTHNFRGNKTHVLFLQIVTACPTWRLISTSCSNYIAQIGLSMMAVHCGLYTSLLQSRLQCIYNIAQWLFIIGKEKLK